MEMAFRPDRACKYFLKYMHIWSTFVEPYSKIFIIGKVNTVILCKAARSVTMLQDKIQVLGPPRPVAWRVVNQCSSCF